MKTHEEIVNDFKKEMDQVSEKLAEELTRLHNERNERILKSIEEFFRKD